MAQKFKPFLLRNIGKITLAALLTGTVISQQQCQRRIREVKRREEEYWRREVEELMRDAEHRGRMDELRRMTEYMITPTNNPGSSMKGSKAMEYNQPKLITTLPNQRKSRLQNLMRHQPSVNTNNETNVDNNNANSNDIPKDESLEKMEKAVEDFENKIKLSALKLTNKDKNKKSTSTVTDIKVPEPIINVNEKISKDLNTKKDTKSTKESVSTNKINEIKEKENSSSTPSPQLIPLEDNKNVITINNDGIVIKNKNTKENNNGNSGWLSWLLPTGTTSKVTNETTEIKNPNVKK